MPQNRETRTAQNPSLLAVGSRPDVLIWRAQAGMFRSMDDPDRFVRVGMPGMADSLAVVEVTITPEMVGRRVGVSVAAEFKTSTGRQSEAQQLWQRAFEARGGVYRIIRSAAEMLALVDDVKAGRAFR